MLHIQNQILILKLKKKFFSLQLCVSVQIPVELGGIGGQAVYIDTSSNFKTSRLLGTSNI